MEIQSVTYSRFFGMVSKALWYSVLDNYNPYVVYMKIYTTPSIGTNIQILNKWVVSSNPEYKNFFPQTQYGIPELFHVPGLKSTDYVILNTP
jgi:hypothetical protein